jgi:hypothetical protein
MTRAIFDDCGAVELGAFDPLTFFGDAFSVATINPNSSFHLLVHLFRILLAKFHHVITQFFHAFNRHGVVQ